VGRLLMARLPTVPQQQVSAQRLSGAATVPAALPLEPAAFALAPLRSKRSASRLSLRW
jgi:hypothetical protein